MEARTLEDFFCQMLHQISSIFVASNLLSCEGVFSRVLMDIVGFRFDISHEVAARLEKILYYKICLYNLTCQMLVWYTFLVLYFGDQFL
jgi:hypothetical protein